MSSNKFRIALVFPGPQYQLEQSFRYRLELLSDAYEGFVYTEGPTAASETFGSFVVRRLGCPDYGGHFPAAAFSANVLRALAADLRGGGRRGLSLVVGYDPLKAGIAALLAARKWKAPLAIEVNGDFWRAECHLDCGSVLRAHVRGRWRGMVARTVLSHATGVRLLHWGQREVLGSRPSATVVCMPDFTDTRAFRNLGEEKIVLSAGFPFLTKGMDVLLRAFASLESEFPDWTLRLVGYGLDKSVERYRGPRPSRLEVLPAVRHAAMPELIGTCGVFVLASRSEGMGRVLLESGAAGKARIGTSVGGIPNVIADGVDGILVPAQDPVALAEGLRQLMGSASLRSRLGRAASIRVAKEMSPEEWSRRTSAFYRAIIESS